MDFTECYGDTVSSVAAAARTGCWKQVRRLIRRGFSVDCRDNRGWNALHEAAAAEGHQNCVEFLLDHGADPNVACSRDWPQLAIHAAAEFGHIGLIAATDRVCDQGDGMVSPIYVAVNRHQSGSVRALLSEGYSPDAQDCTHVLGLHSPLSLALMQAMDFFRFSSFSESVRLLVAAGAHLKEEDWLYALATDQTDLLQLILEYRWISPPETLTRGSSVLQELLCVALEHVQFAPCWLPVLLKAGLQPSLLLQPHVLEHADGDALNYLLEFVNWTTLPKSLKSILDRRREEQTWKPWTHFDTVVSLSHICRLQIRLMLGPDLLMRTSIVQQLPVPPSLHQLACHHKSGLFHEKHWFFQL
uniref:Ankyrin repeat and SOCS box containing 3 n=1 Tax=Takifugu rubripes TaxID=31033 RepID=A0A674MPB9_TAKRU